VLRSPTTPEIAFTRRGSYFVAKLLRGVVSDGFAVACHLLNCSTAHLSRAAPGVRV